jgi:hypothetical protein
MANATATKRPRKTAAERAQADYDAAIKRQSVAQSKLDKVSATIDDLRAEVKLADAEVNFRSQNPALPAQVADVSEAAPADA